jgi:hypothetical protein
LFSAEPSLLVKDHRPRRARPISPAPGREHARRPGRPMRQSAMSKRSLWTTRGAGEGLAEHTAGRQGVRVSWERAPGRVPIAAPHLAVHDRRPERPFSSQTVAGTPGPEEGEERLEFSGQVSRPGALAGWAYCSVAAPVEPAPIPPSESARPRSRDTLLDGLESHRGVKQQRNGQWR